MYEIGKKIAQLRKEQNKTQTDLATYLDLTKQTIIKYEAEKTSIPVDILSKIAIYFNVPVNYFFDENIYNNQERKGNTKIIPILSPVSAGNGNGINIYEDDEVIEWLELSESIAKNADFATFIEGDSMEPRFHDGDLILVEYTNLLNSSEIGVFRVNSDVYCKKLDFNPFTKQYTLKSLNSDYKSIKIQPDDDFKIIGRVVSQIAYNI